MDKTLLKRAAIQSVTLMVTVVISSFALQQYQAINVAASNCFNKNIESLSFDKAGLSVLSQDTISLQQITPAAVTGEVVMARNLGELKNQVSMDLLSKLGDNYLVIKKPAHNELNLQLDDLYINHSILLNMTGLQEDTMTDDMVLRVRGEEFYQGVPVYKEIVSKEVNEEAGTETEVITKDYGTDLCHNITISSKQEKQADQYEAELLLELDKVYAYTIYEDENYYFISLRKPTDVYDKILVIDAGHGGKDAGALSRDEKLYEKNINLAIVLQLKELLDKENIKVYYTRTGDDKVFLRPRVTLANAVDCDYFISIHCNSNEVSYPNGTEVLYYNNTFKNISALKLAGLFSDEIAKTAPLKQRGVVERRGKDIFIMDHAQVPTILIEVGYLSNQQDLNYLCDVESQKAIAQGIFHGIMKAYDEFPPVRN